MPQKPIYLEELFTEINQGISLSKLKLQAWFIRYVENNFLFGISYEIDKDDDGWTYRLIDMYQNTGDMEKDYKLAFNYYLDNAEQGDSEIKCNLGIMYKIGKGTKRDFQKALYWFTKASEEGYEKAKYQIGNMYEYGEGVKQNYLKALDYYIEVGKPISKNTIDKYKEIAENGDSELQYKLGYMYENGIGVPKNSKSAFYWYENAANNGIRDANNKLAWFYYCGKSVTKNIDKAIDLLSKHAEVSDASTQCLLANIYEYDVCDYGNAIKWYEKASQKGDKYATHNLAILYYEGEGVKKDPEKAFELLKKAAEQGNEESLEVLINLKEEYEKSKNKKVKPEPVIIDEDDDYDEDEEWYEDTGEGEEETIESDNLFDEYEKVENEIKEKNQQTVKTAKDKEKELIELIINDISCPELPEERYFNYCKDPAYAFYILGEMYYYGDYIQQDYYKAFRCYAKSTEMGNLYARKKLSFMYYYGEGVEKNYEKAVKLYVDDCSHNNISSEKKLLFEIFGPSAAGENQNLKKAVENNDVKEQIKIGKYFYDNQYSQDYEKALEWYLKAAEHGGEDAESMVRLLYYKLQDYNNLLKWCKKGIEQNHSDAKYFMGWLFLRGYGVEKNIIKTKEWYEKAAEDKDALSQYSKIIRVFFWIHIKSYLFNRFHDII